MGHAAEQASPSVWHESPALVGALDIFELGVGAHESEVAPSFHHKGVHPIVQHVWVKSEVLTRRPRVRQVDERGDVLYGESVIRHSGWVIG